MSYYEFESEAFWWRVERNGPGIQLTRTDIFGEDATFDIDLDAVLPMIRGLLEEYERATK